MKKRKNFPSGFKTKVVLEALQERESIQELAKKYDLHPNQISMWKRKFIQSAGSVFEKGIQKDDSEKEKADLYKKVGQLQMEVDFLKKVLGK
jgi:transposase